MSGIQYVVDDKTDGSRFVHADEFTGLENGRGVLPDQGVGGVKISRMLDMGK